ncbi:3-keto-5-aminohexanoate cleavage protein [Desulfosporosinus sp. PR]|uniref:3-keto-5-aminohexanoate cleavage enzyme n=1 Tax=Candidatus Desulfosporosinus nitrosoreducens TaxID=3401928 RepID=UPI0027FA55D5|nr:3-keto-5-aminohexanoate cleavage protein [Desulfosporosinus sp. PR]MDQ7092024.1 3-keto-5-aminohexanoate cleavage protein [Desulfosporosinus sp. PR]
MEKLIITAALVGAEVTRQQTPFLPYSPREIAAEAKRVWDAGASIVHLHMRDASGNPSSDKTLFAETISYIRSETDLIIQVSTGGALGMTASQRIQPVTLAPEMASVSTGSVNFGKDVFSNPLPMVREFVRICNRHHVKPEIEVFDSSMVENALLLTQEGLLRPPLHFNFVLGVPGGMAATARNLLFLLQLIPQASTWTISGIGRHQLTMNALGILLAGHVRTGLEDNIFWRKGELAKGNAPFVERLVQLAGSLDRPVAAPHEAREILKLDDFAS